MPGGAGRRSQSTSTLLMWAKTSSMPNRVVGFAGRVYLCPCLISHLQLCQWLGSSKGYRWLGKGSSPHAR